MLEGAMGQADIIVKSFFFQYGKNAPSNSEYKEVMTTDSLFGGFFEYTDRKEAVKNSATNTEEKQLNISNVESKSFVGYTSRENAVVNSAKQNYFTMSNEGKLYTKEEREQWVNNSKQYFSQEGDIAWSLVVSIKNYELLKKYGFNGQDDFAKTAQYVMNKSFRNLKMDLSNMVWWEDYHTNTKHPHMHITFIEKENHRARGKFTQKELNTLKRNFVSQIAARANYLEMYHEDPIEVLKNIKKERKTIVDGTAELNYRTIENVVNLYAKLPTKGRLQYNSAAMIPFRERLDLIVDDLLKVTEIKKEYDSFTNKLKSLNQIMNESTGETKDHLVDSEDKKLRTQIANAILKEYKNINQNQLCTIQRMHDSKVSTSTDVLHSILEQSSEQFSAEEQQVCQMINRGSYEAAFAMTDSLTNGENKSFFQASIQFLSNSDEEQGIALQSMSILENDKHPGAHHFMNTYRKSYQLSKYSFHKMNQSITPRLLSATHRLLRTCVIEIDKEIDAYLNNKTRVVSSTKSNQGAEQIAKETEREVQMENYDQGVPV